MNPDEFDLAAWVTDATPILLDAESGEEWGRAKAHRPVTELMAEGGPIADYLNAPTEPPQGTTRAERREFWEGRRAIEQEARESASLAADEHAQVAELLRIRAAIDARDAIGRAAKDDEKGTRVPVKGPDQPADVGRW